MAAPAYSRYNDERLDEMNRRIGAVEPLITEVAVLKTELRNFSKSLDANTKVTGHVSKQLEQAQMEPFLRGRDWRNRLFLVLVGAFTGSGLAYLATILSHQ